MGVMEGGGAGWFLAHWMTHGAPPMDALAIDPRRFGAWADRDYRVEKAIECFGLQFGVHYPHEERPAARGKRLSPIHVQMIEAGAVMGSAYGWERPNWFSDKKADEARPSFRRSNWFEAVARECEVVTTSVGLGDMSVFAKFEISGPDTEKFLDTLGANTAPEPGRIGLTHALTPAGGTQAEFTVTRLAAEQAYLTSAAAAEEMDSDLLQAHSSRYDVVVKCVSDDWGVLGVMGPKSRQLLQTLTDADLDYDFAWLSAREITVATVPVRALRVSYIGESGWELHAENEHMPALFDALVNAGKPLGLGFFGAYAMNAMRLEKGYRAWGSDFTTERTPAETGAGFLIKPEGRSFTGKDALLARMASDERWEMVLMELKTQDVDPFYSHPVMHLSLIHI